MFSNSILYWLCYEAVTNSEMSCPFCNTKLMTLWSQELVTTGPLPRTDESIHSVPPYYILTNFNIIPIVWFYTASNAGWFMLNNKVWEESARGLIRIVYSHLSRDTEEDHVKPQWGKSLNRLSCRIKSTALLLHRSFRSVSFLTTDFCLPLPVVIPPTRHIQSWYWHHH